MKVTSEITQVSTRNYITGNGLEDMAFTLAWALWYAAMALMLIGLIDLIGLLHIKERGIKRDTPTKNTMLSVMFYDVQKNCFVLSTLLSSIYFIVQNRVHIFSMLRNTFAVKYVLSRNIRYLALPTMEHLFCALSNFQIFISIQI